MSVLFIVALFLSPRVLVDSTHLSGSARKSNSTEDLIQQHRHGHNKRSVLSDDGILASHQQRKLAYWLSLDPDSNFHLSWTPDFQREQIQFRVDVRRSPPQSWFALGFSDRGDWAGSDLCVGWEDWKGTFIVQVLFIIL